MSNQFFVILPSNTKGYDNKPHKFRVNLPQTLSLKGDWMVGMHSIVFPYSWNSIGTTHDQYMDIYLKPNAKHIRVPIPGNSYNSPQALQKSLKSNMISKLESIFAKEHKSTINRLKRTISNLEEESPLRKKRDVNEVLSNSLNLLDQHNRYLQQLRNRMVEEEKKFLQPSTFDELFVVAQRWDVLKAKILSKMKDISELQVKILREQHPNQNEEYYQSQQKEYENRDVRETDRLVTLAHKYLKMMADVKREESRVRMIEERRIAQEELQKQQVEITRRQEEDRVKQVEEKRLIESQKKAEENVKHLNEIEKNLETERKEKETKRIQEEKEAVEKRLQDQVNALSKIEEKREAEEQERRTFEARRKAEEEVRVREENILRETQEQAYRRNEQFKEALIKAAVERKEAVDYLEERKTQTLFHEKNYSFPEQYSQKQILTYLENINFEFVTDADRFRVTINNEDIAYISLSPQINYVLGFEENQTLVNGDIAKYSYDLKGGVSNLFVYANGLTENMIVGDSMASLLRIVTVSGKSGDVVEQIYTAPIFNKVKAKDLNEIEIEIKTMDNRYVKFDWGSILITLVFKKAIYF